MTFDMNRVWLQAIAIVSANWQYLALIGGIFFLLPNLLVVVAFPDVFSALQAPVADAEELIARMTPLVPALLAIGLGTLFFSTIGYAAMILLLGHARPTVGEALGAALRALPTLIGCVLVAIVGYLAFAMLGTLAAALLALVLSFVIGQAGASMVGILLLVAVLVWLAVRFVLVTPVVMLEGVTNPLTAFTRSWQLTRSCHRRLLGFLALLLVPYMVISGVVSMVAGLPGSMFFNVFANGLLSLAFTMLLTAILVALHQQLAGGMPQAAAEFE